MRKYLLVFLVLSGCNYAQFHDPGQGPQSVQCAPTESGASVVTYEQVRSEVFAGKCFKCHSGNSGAGGVLLDTYDAARSRASQIQFDVVNNIMPKAPNPSLTQPEKDLVTAWVQAGAPNASSSAACQTPGTGTKPPATSPTPTPAPAPTPTPINVIPADSEINFTLIKDRIFALHCLGCHSPAGGNAGRLNLTSYGETLDEIEDIEEQLIDQTMPPPPRPALSQVEREVVLRWMQLGAPN